MNQLLILFVSVVVAVGRLTIPGHAVSLAGTYEAFAHIFVGILLYACFAESSKEMRKLSRWSIVAISVLELVMFANRVEAQQINFFSDGIDDEKIEPIRDYASGFQVARVERRPLLILFTQKVCPPCKVAKRTFDLMRQEGELRNCVLVEIDGGTQEARHLMTGRQLPPQLVLLDMRSQSSDKSVDRFATEIITKPKVLELLDRLPVPMREPVTIDEIGLPKVATTFEASPATGPPPRVITYSIATQYKNGIYQGSFDWGGIDQALNFLGRYKNVVFRRIGTNGAQLRVVQANYQLNNNAAVAAWTSGSQINISPIYNYGKNSYLAKKVIVHESGHAFGGGGHNPNPGGIMSINAGTSHNLIPSDYPWYQSLAWKATVRPDQEPEFMKDLFVGNVSLAMQAAGDEAFGKIQCASESKSLIPVRDTPLYVAP